ncbi:hypothetical protein BJ944DRAFT_244237 [Cunninghamella echinulata]|nr:hypothetical protein BJ944DRAFT_244237 [Cunninghamella echinulata]
MQYIQAQPRSFILTGYVQQNDISTVYIRDRRYKTLKVYTKDEQVHTYYFPIEDTYILNDIIQARSTMRRNGKTIGTNRVKGICNLLGYELGNGEVTISQVIFHPNNLPRRIAQIMKETRLQEGPVRQVTRIDRQSENQSIDLEVFSEGEYRGEYEGDENEFEEERERN